MSPVKFSRRGHAEQGLIPQGNAAHRGAVHLKDRPPGCEVTIELPRAAGGVEIRE